MAQAFETNDENPEYCLLDGMAVGLVIRGLDNLTEEHQPDITIEPSDQAGLNALTKWFNSVVQDPYLSLIMNKGGIRFYLTLAFHKASTPNHIKGFVRSCEQIQE